MRRIVLAYSGGFDTSLAIPWLAETTGAEIVTVTIDLGQGRDLADIRESALALGCIRAHVVDARDELVRDFVIPSLQAGALYRDLSPQPAALGRALIAKKLIEIARMEGAGAIAHGCSAAGTDRLRIEQALRALDPDIEVMAPAHAWAESCFDKIEYARAHRIPVPSFVPACTTTANLWGRSISCPAGGPGIDRLPGLYVLTRPRSECPDQPAYIDVTFESGIPVAANGIEMPLLELIESLETIAGAHGVGRIDAIDDGVTGATQRDACEAPAAVVLHLAHRELERVVLPPDLARLKRIVMPVYADLVHDDRWFSDTREALDAFVRAVQGRVSGTVRLKLLKGDCRVVAGRSPQDLYHRGSPVRADDDRTDTALALRASPSI